MLRYTQNITAFLLVSNQGVEPCLLHICRYVLLILTPRILRTTILSDEIGHKYAKERKVNWTICFRYRNFLCSFARLNGKTLKHPTYPQRPLLMLNLDSNNVRVFPLLCIEYSRKWYLVVTKAETVIYYLIFDNRKSLCLSILIFYHFILTGS